MRHKKYNDNSQDMRISDINLDLRDIDRKFHEFEIGLDRMIFLAQSQNNKEAYELFSKIKYDYITRLNYQTSKTPVMDMLTDAAVTWLIQGENDDYFRELRQTNDIRHLLNHTKNLENKLEAIQYAFAKNRSSNEDLNDGIIHLSLSIKPTNVYQDNGFVDCLSIINMQKEDGIMNHAMQDSNLRKVENFARICNSIFNNIKKSVDANFLQSCISNDVKLAELWLQFGANPNIYYKNAPLSYYFAKNSNIEMLELLSKYKVKFDKNVVDIAIKNNDIELCEFLLQKNTPVSDKSLYNAANQGNLELVKLLYEYDEKLLNYINRPKLTWSQWFHEKVYGVSFIMTKLYGEPKIYGKSALHVAAKNGHIDVVSYLEDKTNDKIICIKDTNGFTYDHYMSHEVTLVGDVI
jgi:ankyrin repeat protein